MSVASNVKFTYEDYKSFPEDGKRYEIIDGERFVAPSPSTAHQRVTLQVATFLNNFLRGSDVVLSETDIVQPDVLYVSNTHLPRINELNLRGAPDLAVEVLSATSRKRDEVLKRKLYEKSGVAEYWIFDPELEQVKVWRLRGGVFHQKPVLSTENGDSLESPLLPGFTAPLTEVFAG